MVSSRMLVTISGVITMSLMGCDDSSSGTCPDGSTFPESPQFVTGSGTLIGTETRQGEIIDYSGSVKLWFADHNVRMFQEMSATHHGVTLNMQSERIQVCANNSTTITAHAEVSVGGQDRSDCASNGPVAATCATVSVFGEPDEASCKGLEKCPGSSSSKLCEVWTINPSSSHTKMLGSLPASVAKAWNPTMEFAVGTMAECTVTLYVLNGTNQLVAEKHFQDGIDMVIYFDSWDTTTKVTADQFDVPTEWEPCSSDGVKTDDESAEIQV